MLHRLKLTISALIGLFMFPSFALADPADLLQNFVMPEGYSEISQNVADALLEQGGDLVLIDVRTPEEFAQGHIAGAINIPVEELREKELLPQVPSVDTPILLYCRSGRRAVKAGQLLVRNGYRHVMNFGGVLTWQFGLVGED